ncbi:MAG: hypothetical protein QXK76_00765 [Candidatus Woesearchaeota archaeon]
MFSKNSSQGVIETCRISVLAQAKLELAGTSPLSLNCLRRYIDIYKDHVELGNQPDKTKTISIYNKGKKSNRYKELNEDIVNYIVAEEMRICWYQFGEAKTEIFPNNEKLTEIIGTADDDICFICSEIEFIDIKNKQYTGLIEYLKNNYPKDKKYTYWEYFNQPSLSEHTLEKYIDDCYKDKIDELWNNNRFVFESDKTYAVIFYKDYDDTLSINPIGILSPSCSDEGGKSGYHVLVLPTENLEEICEIQAS